jgi:KDO2-lipid IV(A) lauroyltransferase
LAVDRSALRRPSPQLRGRLKALIAGIRPSSIMRFGGLLGNLMYTLDTSRRGMIRRNLEFVHPEWSRSQINEFCRRNFQHYAVTLLEILQSSCMSAQDLRSRLRISGGEHLVRALGQGKGAIIISAHLGNFELALQYPVCFLNHPMTGVAKKLHYRLRNRWIHGLRTRFGNKLLYNRDAVPAMIKTLRRGELLGILVDQSRNKLSFDIAFLGRKGTMTYAPALLARRCKSPILPVFCVREADGGLALQVNPPLEIQKTRDVHADLRVNTQKIADVVENAILNTLRSITAICIRSSPPPDRAKSGTTANRPAKDSLKNNVTKIRNRQGSSFQPLECSARTSPR